MSIPETHNSSTRRVMRNKTRNSSGFLSYCQKRIQNKMTSEASKTIRKRKNKPKKVLPGKSDSTVDVQPQTAWTSSHTQPGGPPMREPWSPADPWRGPVVSTQPCSEAEITSVLVSHCMATATGYLSARNAKRPN